MSRRTLTSNAFHSAAATLNAAVAERRAQRLTPPAPPPPRDSDPQAGEALPDHSGGLDADAHPGLAPSVAAWAWSGDADSDDGASRR